VIPLSSKIAAAQRNRGTIFVEDAVLVEKKCYASQQFKLRLTAPKIAGTARAGSFVHIQCGPGIQLRRPLSILRTDAVEGWIEIMFKVVGHGLRQLSDAKIGDRHSCIGPVGHGFEPHPDKPRTLLVGGGVGIPPLILLTAQLLADNKDWRPLVLMGSEVPFPFDLSASALQAEWAPGDAFKTVALLEDWGVPARLASLAGIHGCYKGFVTGLAHSFLHTLAPDELLQTEIYACGPLPMLHAVARLAVQFGLPCQVSLEEFMACGVGGCAGCIVEVHSPDGPLMQRVCVDGPVFEAGHIFVDALESSTT